jgi:hypothetical protein
MKRGNHDGITKFFQINGIFGREAVEVRVLSSSVFNFVHSVCFRHSVKIS